MPAQVNLQVTRGALKGQSYEFSERATCLIGRAEDCHPRLPDDEAHRTISRHHCLVELNPPAARIRDFGSLNGTYVNGRKIGQRKLGQSLSEAAGVAYPEHDLHNGDVVTLGGTDLAVAIEVPPRCADCGIELSPAPQPGDQARCESCRRRAEAARSPEPSPAACAVCGRTGGDAEQLNSMAICSSCRKDPAGIIKALLMAARQGRKELTAIEGYTVLRELGRGGMGAVYLARHERTGDQVALKVMLPQVARDPEAEKRFLREAQLTKRLRHRNLVHLYDLGSAQGTFFFTLELCDLGAVDELMQRRGGRLEIDEAMAISLQVLDGLHYAHHVIVDRVEKADGGVGRAQGLVHRDLKPGNIFLAGGSGGPIAKIGDYGLGKAFDIAGLSGFTMTGSAAGTPTFMPRQQVINFKYAKPEVDVWAAAASLYAMLTGAPPRDFSAGKDPWRVVLQDAPVPIRKRAPAIPKKLATVIDAALQDNPTITFTSAMELRQALQRAV